MCAKQFYFAFGHFGRWSAAPCKASTQERLEYQSNAYEVTESARKSIRTKSAEQLL